MYRFAATQPGTSGGGVLLGEGEMMVRFILTPAVVSLKSYYVTKHIRSTVVSWRQYLNKTIKTPTHYGLNVGGGNGQLTQQVVQQSFSHGGVRFVLSLKSLAALLRGGRVHQLLPTTFKQNLLQSPWTASILLQITIAYR